MAELSGHNQERSVMLGISVSTAIWSLTFIEPLLKEHLGERPQLRAMRGLAGPNHIVQFLFDGWTWIDVAKGAMVAFGVGGMQKLGEMFTESIIKRLRRKGVDADKPSLIMTDRIIPKSFYEALLTHINMAQTLKDTVLFGINVEPSDRNIGMVVPNTPDMNDMISTIFIVSSVALEVESFLRENSDFYLSAIYPDGQNVDCSTKLLFLDDGTLRIRVVDKDNKG